jgi:opacity protein-like surface antigen
VKVTIMKSLFRAVAVFAAIVGPATSFAQSSQPVTRADVRADLVRVEQAGYNPGDWLHYPENIQAAQARVAEQNGNTAYGAGTDGSSQSGQRRDVTFSSYSPPVEVIGH